MKDFPDREKNFNMETLNDIFKIFNDSINNEMKSFSLFLWRLMK